VVLLLPRVEQRDEATYDVMISYRSTDTKFVNMLQHVLEEAGITCWRDRRMEVGTNWSEDITRAVRTSRCVVCCISDNYVKSSLCTKEVLMAHDMGKIIIPLVLPHSEAKESDFLKMVRLAYPSAHPPHVVAREIVKTTWFDFRPFSYGPDPTELLFETKYPLVTHLKRQVNNIKRKGWLWDLDGTWQFEFYQEGAENAANLASFDAEIVFEHTKYALNGSGTLTANEELKVISDRARLDTSVLTFGLKILSDSTGDSDSHYKVIFISAMVGIDGKSLSGKFAAFHVGNWCSPFGTVVGKLIAEKIFAKKTKEQ